MEEWKELLKVKEEEIQHLRDQASTVAGTDSQDSGKARSRESGQNDDFTQDVIKKLEEEIQLKVDELEKVKKDLEDMDDIKKDLVVKEDKLKEMEDHMQKKYDKIAELEKQLLDDQQESKRKEDLLQQEISTLKAQ